MSASEVGWRVDDQIKKWVWRPQQVTPSRSQSRLADILVGQRSPVLRPFGGDPRFTAVLADGVLRQVPSSSHESVIAAADEIMLGRWALLGVTRCDMEDPDWFFDPVTGRTAPSTPYCFGINYRSEEITGNVKQVWELSRMQHITVLASAYALSGDERYADRAAKHLRSWWAKNPFLSGVHWTSGIELGLRLISWVWARRMLDGWKRAPALFERNGDALEQIWWHQRYLERYRSRGSSANNHVIAEAAGQLVASLAFNWFRESDGWADHAAGLLEAELAKNTFPSGVNREMASEYHGFVLELGLLAAVEADRAGRPLSDETWGLLRRMTEAVAATSDAKLRPVRQGDGDDGRALLFGAAEDDRWASLIALGAKLFGALDWWPPAEADVASTLIGSLAHADHNLAGPVRPARRPSHYADAGLTVLRSQSGDAPENLVPLRRWPARVPLDSCTRPC